MTTIIREKKVWVLHFKGKHILTTPIKQVADHIADRLDTMLEYPDHDYETCLEELFKAVSKK